MLAILAASYTVSWGFAFMTDLLMAEAVEAKGERAMEDEMETDTFPTVIEHFPGGAGAVKRCSGE